jgi:hypothetical protein
MDDSAAECTRAVRDGTLVLTTARAEVFRAVEGLALSPRMRQLLANTDMHALSSEARRALVLAELRNP